MNNQINTIINFLLLSSTSSVSVDFSSDKKGFSIKNQSLNCKTFIFSDELHNLYIELAPIFSSKPGAIYKSCISEFLPLLLQINKTLEKTHRLNKKKESFQYIDLFKLALKNKELPDNFSVTHTKHKIEIRQKNIRSVMFLKQEDIQLIKLNLQHETDPTATREIKIYGEYESYFYISKYKLPNYPLLQIKKIHMMMNLNLYLNILN